MSGNSPGRFRRFLTFRLATIFIVIGAIASALAYWRLPRQMDTSAWLAIQRDQLLAIEPYRDTAWEEAEFRRFCELQANLARSSPVLSEAVADPKIASLPILKGRKDPVEFLAQRLKTSFPSERFLVLRMSGTEDEIDQLRQILDAIVKSCVERARENQDRRTVIVGKRLDSLEQRSEEALRNYAQQLRLFQTAQADTSPVTVDVQLTQAKLERQKWLLDEIARRKLILQFRLTGEPTLQVWGNATIHSPKLTF